MDEEGSLRPARHSPTGAREMSLTWQTREPLGLALGALDAGARHPWSSSTSSRKGRSSIGMSSAAGAGRDIARDR
jgi:hypothetical protein